jgi:hypothetical protein
VMQQAAIGLAHGVLIGNEEVAVHSLAASKDQNRSVVRPYVDAMAAWLTCPPILLRAGLPASDPSCQVMYQCGSCALQVYFPPRRE